MPRITIPTIGTEITLEEDWRFGLFPEDRNDKLWKMIVGTDPPGWRESLVMCENGVFSPVTLPAGTVLIVDRIYLRKGGSDFDSITFRIKECPSNKALAKKRFWAKLHHVNLIKGTWNEQTVPRADEDVKPPEDVLIHQHWWKFLWERVPDEIHDALMDQCVGNMTKHFEVHIRNGLVQVLESVDGSQVEIFMESRSEKEE